MIRRNRFRRPLIDAFALLLALSFVVGLWREHPVLASVVAALILTLIGVALLLRRYNLHKQGYLVGPAGRDSIRYEELADGAVRSLVISGEMLNRAPHVVYLPDPESWEKKMPVWAQPRRTEIIERVKKTLGTVRYQFEEVHSRGA